MKRMVLKINIPRITYLSWPISHITDMSSQIKGYEFLSMMDPQVFSDSTYFIWLLTLDVLSEMILGSPI